ncbi:endonuclease/exonuclease/phosphatase family protein [Psychromonas aquimarina]|uniref:endonuclease/exonuclease/phosphatase family protein n=1 Tax=Psychromonas aquimarina TaxID=444919 RepID=UPI003CCC1A67
MHPASPRTEKLWQLRNATLAYAVEQVSSSSLPYKIVIGDFNSTPWSANFKYFQKNTLLKNSAEGFGYIASWSYSTANQLISMLSSAYIDHCLVSDSFTVLNKQYQTVQGSDHLLLLTELAVESPLQKDLHYAKKL